ncbi:MAG TPA: ABC transporter ATP-binding protein [Saprospiraceae bacterium]|nr:ABC transporter ATP-binding protein [Saprospiraceae bacterium]
MGSFWRLMKYLRNYRWYVALAIFSNILTAVFTVVSIPFIKPFLDILFNMKEVSREPVELSLTFSKNNFNEWLDYQSFLLIEQYGSDQAVFYVCLGIVLVFFLKNAFRYLGLFFMAPVRNGVIRDLRSQLFDKMLDLPLSYFSEERKGDLMSRITGDVQEVEWSILNVLVTIFREPIILLGSVIFMLVLSPQLTLFVFVLIIFTGVVIGGVGRSLRKPSAGIQQLLGKLVSIIEEVLSGLRIIKGFNAEGYQRAKFEKENDDYRWSLTKLLWRKDLASPLSEFLGITTVALLLWYGSRQVFSGELSAGSFMTFIFAFYYVIDPAKSFSKAFYNIQKGIAALDRVEQVLDSQNSIVDPVQAKTLSGFRQKIEYDQVGFAYRDTEGPVLQNINLSIEKGKIIALVGASGAGKSTLVDLLPRFYDVTTGSIRIDGTDIRDLKLKDLRGLMGIVSQEAILFNDTIYNNIVFGLEQISPAQVEAAAKIANAHDFIMATDQGYQTVIGDRGSKLSGGQRQRLTIARAVLKNPPILILDEATSALDSESEKWVQEALIKLMQKRTSIVIAHRLSTIQHADEIIVMDEGRIIERGTHKDLLQLNGAYSKLVALQNV